MIMRHAPKEALEAALDVANARYRGNLAFRTFEPATRKGMSWRVQLAAKNPDGRPPPPPMGVLARPPGLALCPIRACPGGHGEDGASLLQGLEGLRQKRPANRALE